MRTHKNMDIRLNLIKLLKNLVIWGKKNIYKNWGRNEGRKLLDIKEQEEKYLNTPQGKHFA